MKTLGIILLLAGFIMTLFTGFHEVTRKQVTEMGSVQINRKVRTPIEWGPAAGSVLVVAGVVIVVAGKNRRKIASSR
ncbi:MAG TPA: hypothetical protein VFW11_02295 [Cyclobacteriaceae bacterium]|nr:hypothetical protein [Cyclobacteriaceae bacterium]